MAGYLAGLHGLTRNLALDLKPLRVNLVSPGVVETPLWGADGVPEMFKSGTTLGKVGVPDEVAEAYVYLMKDTNATGSCVSTNSGSLLM
jgi:NAD(P)-dependent dehydrogenase (short-subunit alcohol dehydrogenase family)